MLDILLILDRHASEHHAKRTASLDFRLRALRTAFFVCAALFVIAAVNHAVLAARGDGVVWRHELFVGINLAAAAGLALRPRWTLAPLALLACQQIPSHGADFVRSLRTPAIDWPSLGVVLFFPAVLTLLVVARRRHRPGSPSPGPRGS